MQILYYISAKPLAQELTWAHRRDLRVAIPLLSWDFIFIFLIVLWAISLGPQSSISLSFS